MTPTSIVEPLQDMSVTPIEPSHQNPTPPVSIVDPSKQNPSSFDEIFQEIPTTLVDDATEKTAVTFSFQLHPAIKMKQALASLCEEHFNPQGLGIFEVDKDGLEITVYNAESGARGHLWLKATGLINFKCNKEMIKKWVNMNHILKNLVGSADKDTISIHHLDGSNQLLFSFGSAPPRQFSVELLELDASYEKFPNITYACEAVVLCDNLRQMIEEYQATLTLRPEIVSASVREDLLEVWAGKKEWQYLYFRRGKMNGIRGLEGEQRHYAWFHWPHCEFLKKASFLAPAFLLCFVIDPPEQIMLRFNLRELGDLVYLNKSVLTLFNAHEIEGANLGLGHLATAASLV